jgi:hypothetical protein
VLSAAIFAVFQPMLSGVLVSQMLVFGGKYIGSTGGIGVEFGAGFSLLLLQEIKKVIKLIRRILFLILYFFDC